MAQSERTYIEQEITGHNVQDNLGSSLVTEIINISKLWSLLRITTLFGKLRMHMVTVR